MLAKPLPFKEMNQCQNMCKCVIFESVLARLCFDAYFLLLTNTRTTTTATAIVTKSTVYSRKKTDMLKIVWP